MKHLLQITLIACLSLVSAAPLCFGGMFTRLPKVKFTLEVVDDVGQVVTGALAAIGMTENGGFDVLTDFSGRVIVEGEVSLLSLGGQVSKGGYYTTHFFVDLSMSIPDDVNIGRRLPDVMRRVVLRPVINPVPMYAYEYFSKIPIENQDIGFDFLEADWVAPYGKGVTNDVLIRVDTYDKAMEGLEGGEFCWRFPRPGDGMVRVATEEEFRDGRDWESEYLLPRLAPVNGYVAGWTNKLAYASNRVLRVNSVVPPGPEFKRPSYILRIRSNVNGEGVVTNALYGKIIARGSDGISWDYARCNSKAEVGFTYYVNPYGTRNLEFDPRRNLFRCRDGDGHIMRRRLPDWP